MCNRSFLLFVVAMLLVPMSELHSTERCTKCSGIELTVLQLNLWVECTKVENASQYVIEQIAYIKPDIATFCELYKGEEENPIIPRLTERLSEKGMHYYSAQVDGRAVISKYPIIEKERVNKWMFKAVLNVSGNRVAVYPFHSEYRYYACYLPRGYNDGSANWEKLSSPIVDVDQILSSNRKSGRIESNQTFIANAKKEIERGAAVFFAGDLNEPSHLDWQENTKNIRDHRGCVVDWDVSKLLYSNGFKDAYREKYPDAVNYPGFTFPADNKSADISQLTWAADADERERIDFIYYYPRNGLRVKDAKIAGPSGAIIRSKRINEKSNDFFISSNNDHWPTDHKGVFITFVLK